jgi:hypothetical protein
MGVFVPGLLVWALLALVLSGMVRRLLRRWGVYRLVWHPPLFDAAIFLVLLGGVVAVADWIGK